MRPSFIVLLIMLSGTFLFGQEGKPDSFSKATHPDSITPKEQSIAGTDNFVLFDPFVTPWYTQVPIRHAQALRYTITVWNASDTVASNLTMYLRTFFEGALVSIESQSGGNLEAFEETDLSVTSSITPNQIGSYVATLGVFSNQQAETTIQVPFINEVTETVYARDIGIETLALNPVNSNVVGLAGQDFELIADDALTQVQFHVVNPSPFHVFRARVFDQVNGVPTHWIGTSDSILTAPIIDDYWFTVNFPGGLALPAGKYTICIDELTTNTWEIGLSSPHEPGSTWALDYWGDWVNLDGYADNSMMIRANLNGCPDPIADFQPEQWDGLTYIFYNQSQTSGSTSRFWEFSDGQIAFTQNPLVTFQEPGTYEACLTITDFCGAHTACQMVDVTGSVSVEEFEGQTNFQLFPNPANTQVLIQWPNKFEVNQIDLRNSNGQLLRHLPISPGMEQISMDLIGLPEGTYILVWQSTARNYSKKLLIHR
ncbi:MAG: PKD domain-containing protein [Bacteroidota bacterium]